MEPEPEERAEAAPLVGFIFGNVDKSGEVEADYLDAVNPLPSPTFAAPP